MDFYIDKLAESVILGQLDVTEDAETDAICISEYADRIRRNLNDSAIIHESIAEIRQCLASIEQIIRNEGGF